MIIFTRSSLKLVLKKITLQVSTLLFLIGCFTGPAFAQSLDVDQPTMDLIIDSVMLELVHNPNLRDPQDNLPVGVFYTSIEVLSLSVQPKSTTETLFIYQVRVPFETVRGVEGDLLCSASYLVSDLGAKPKRAVCYAQPSLEIYDDEDEGFIFDDGL